MNADGVVNPIDALFVINHLNRKGSGPIDSAAKEPPPYFDVNSDDSITPIDALIVINHLNRRGFTSRIGDRGSSEGEPTAETVTDGTAWDLDTFSDWDFLHDVAEQNQRRRRFRI